VIVVFLQLISDFNIEPLASFLRKKPGWKDLKIDVAPFGQVYPMLAAEPDARTGNEYWGRIIWTMPDRVIPHFASACNLEAVDHDLVLQEVDHFANAILQSDARQNQFVASWVLPRNVAGYGMLDWRPGLGLRNLLARMNLRLAEKLAVRSNIYMLNTDAWLGAAVSSEPTKLWYATKVPYAAQVFEHAAAEISGAVAAIQGHARKLVVVDLDDTLWGGVVGETGWQGIRLGGHDHIGEAFKDFQRELKQLSNRGIQLAIVSKNDEAVAIQAIDSHPEMVLRQSDFAGWRINWQDKAANILELAKELNLGLASLVFIDDNPVERDRVASALPDVLVPDWPKDPTAYVAALRTLNCFQAAAISSEDRNRKQSYVANRERQHSIQSADSEVDWLHRLQTRMRVDKVSDSNIARVAQLFNKTNQLNLSTRRMSEREILDWQLAPNQQMLAVSVSDHFGDLGLVGIVGLEVQGVEGKLVDYILSCRVMGRKVEEALLYVASDQLFQSGADVVTIQYLPTERNRPTLDVLHKAGVVETQPNTFKIERASPLLPPASVAIERNDA
jgi:FkbH-like protein